MLTIKSGIQYSIKYEVNECNNDKKKLWRTFVELVPLEVEDTNLCL